MTNPNAANGNKGEQSAESAGEGHLEALTKEAGKFDPEQARNLVEQDRSKDTEKTLDGTGPARLAIIAEKQEKELSPQDAANEYLSLLDELGQDFTNPDYKDGSTHFPHIVGDGGTGIFSVYLGKKYSDNPRHHLYGHGTKAGEHDMTMMRILAAEGLIQLEMQWRKAGKEAEEHQSVIDEKISNLDSAYSQKNKIAKFFGKKKYEKARKGLISDKNSAGRFATQQTNRKMEEELSIVYNENGGRYANIPYNKEKRESQNEKYSRQFFGLDDPERAAKIERAIELRQKYEAEWSKKK